MGLRERIARPLLEQAEARLSETQAHVEQVIQRGLLLLEAQSEISERRLAETLANIDPDDYLYRPAGEADRWTRSLGAMQHNEVVEACFDLYKRNPLGHRITELTRDFVVGDGITCSCLNPNVEDVVGEFWHDPDNNLDIANADFALELGLYGELIPEAFVGERSGIVKLGYIDVSQVKRVSVVERQEDVAGKTITRRNPRIPDIVWIREKGFKLKGRPLEIIRPRDGKLSGDVFFFKVNSPQNSPRGWPDLMHIADWLQAMDAMLWEISERARLIRTFIWDVTYKGDEGQLREYARKNSTPPRSGSVRVHNENVEWNAVSPTIGSYEAAKERDVILEHIGGGAGLPKTWLSSAEDVNRATAQEMGGPAIRKLGHRQNQYVDVLKKMLAFVLSEAREAGRLRQSDADAKGRFPAYDASTGKPAVNAKTGEPVMLYPHELVQIHAPEISPKDTASAATVLQQVTAALVIAQEQNWIGHDPARQILATVLQGLGVDYDPNSEDLSEPEAKETDQEPASRRELEREVAESLAG